MGGLDQESTGFPEQFMRAAAPAGQKVAITLEIDPDILEWLKTEPGGAQRQVNDLLRFWKDSSEAQPAPEPDAWEPGEMTPAMEIA